MRFSPILYEEKKIFLYKLKITYRVFLLVPPEIVRVQIPLLLAEFETVNVANVVNVMVFEL